MTLAVVYLLLPSILTALSAYATDVCYFPTATVGLVTKQRTQTETGRHAVRLATHAWAMVYVIKDGPVSCIANPAPTGLGVRLIVPRLQQRVSSG